jgi:mono/diheme cytochrome c family protein
MVVVVLLVALFGVLLPRRLPRVALLIPFAATIALLGSFERVREFIRKPYIIGQYMYANGIRVEEAPLLREEGVLRHATYTSVREVTEDNRIEAGAEIFRLTCTRCHTATGVNAVPDRLRAMYGDGAWDRDTVKYYLLGMHVPRPFMPPFPGTETEAGALADYLIELRRTEQPAVGAQDGGIEAAPPTDGGV